MRRLVFFISLIVLGNFCFAYERVGVMTSSGPKWTPSELDYISPCQEVHFLVDYNIPPIYVSGERYDWFVNGLLVKSTTDLNDKAYITGITNPNTEVFCNVYYRDNYGLLQMNESTHFSPLIKSLNFGSINYVGNTNYGCGSTVDFTLNQYDCDPYCGTIFKVLPTN